MRERAQPPHPKDRVGSGVPMQVAALCWRRHRGVVEVLLVTSRRRRRWILPKGWPIEGKRPERAAEIEAMEEAGAIGRAKRSCIGYYTYTKERADGTIPCVVSVFPMQVKRELEEWPERSERVRRWVTLEDAVQQVDDVELRPILATFAPDRRSG